MHLTHPDEGSDVSLVASLGETQVKDLSLPLGKPCNQGGELHAVDGSLVVAVLGAQVDIPVHSDALIEGCGTEALPREECLLDVPQRSVQGIGDVGQGREPAARHGEALRGFVELQTQLLHSSWHPHSPARPVVAAKLAICGDRGEGSKHHTAIGLESFGGLQHTDRRHLHQIIDRFAPAPQSTRSRLGQPAMGLHDLVAVTPIAAHAIPVQQDHRTFVRHP